MSVLDAKTEVHTNEATCPVTQKVTSGVGHGVF